MNVPDYFTAETYEKDAPETGKAEGQTLVARWFASECADQILHVHGIGWLYWDGKRWAEDLGARRVRSLLLGMVDRLAARAVHGDGGLLKALASTYRSDSYQEGVLNIARILPNLSADVSDLDADPWALNVANGTLNLRTMRLRPHSPGDFHTKVTRGSWDKDADSPEWKKFLERVLPDIEVREYLQRFAGVSLIGEVLEQMLGIATGTGANGKGVFYEAFMNALGDYAHTAESDLFMTSKSNAQAAAPAIVALRGARFVVCSETEEGKPLAAALMKNLTGGDRITARGLRRDPITFTPSHTALMVTNHLPVVKGDDAAVWRRLKVIPFDVVIPEAERDTGLGRLLAEHADAILSWAIMGLQDYLTDKKMRAPAAVQARTSEYQVESDVMGRFFSEALVIEQGATSSMEDLYAAYGKWCVENGERPSSLKEFREYLKRKGYEAKLVKIDGRPSRRVPGLRTPQNAWA